MGAAKAVMNRLGRSFMIDFHSHFLPKMDDGSSNLGESLQMLKQSYKCGIDTIVSTSHYYSEHETIDEFLRRRDEKMSWLLPQLAEIDEIPKIVLGAEVSFFSGIAGEKNLQKLCIAGTKYLMIEMPYADWNSLDIRELRSLLLNRGITPILAHAERYFPYQQRNRIDELLNLGVVIQVNSESVIDSKLRKPILKLIRSGIIHILGSDCHNTKDRPPNLDVASNIIENEVGILALKRIDQNGRRILNDDFI